MADSTDKLKQAMPLADRCVKCGLCLPECPTYRLYADENESPRGRIALIEGLARQQLQADDKVRAHIDRCLQCRRCENICPSLVPYGELLDLAHAALPRKLSLGTRIGMRPALSRRLQTFARVLPVLPAEFGTMQKIARAMPAQKAPSAGLYPTRKTRRGRIGLHLGCATQTNQSPALWATIRLLNHAGYDVVVPRGQTCCGAIDWHHGRREEAVALQNANRRAFADTELQTLVSIASACTAQLRDYQPAWPVPVVEICHFLAQDSGLSREDFNHDETGVAIHHPCSLRNVLHSAASTEHLLKEIAGVNLTVIGSSNDCCGASGDHMIRRRDQAVRLREPLLHDTRVARAGVLLTSNVGCALHLAEGLYPDIPVKHPVELLAERLEESDDWF